MLMRRIRILEFLPTDPFYFFGNPEKKLIT